MGFSDCFKSKLNGLVPLNLQKYVGNIQIPEDKINDIINKNKIELQDKIAKEKEAINSQASSENAAKDKEVDKVKASGHLVQEAEKSIKYREQVVTGAKFTKPIDLQDADYTTSINYPHRYGHIDSVKNWWVIDKKDKYAEFVHSSGSLFHIDKDGNVSIHITGSLKLIVDKDTTIETRGSMDNIIKESHFIGVGSELEIEVGANSKLTVGLANTMSAGTDTTINSGASHTNVAGGMFTIQSSGKAENISGNSSSNSAGSVNIQSSSAVKIQGSTIDLN